MPLSRICTLSSRVVVSSSVLLVSISGCALGERVAGETPPANPSSSSSKAPFAGSRYVNKQGFPLSAKHDAVGITPTVDFSDGQQIARPGSHFITVAVSVANLTDDRPAPFRIGEPPLPPEVWLLVPKEDAKRLKVACVRRPAVVKHAPGDNWCALPLIPRGTDAGFTSWATMTLPADSVTTDYLYSKTPFPDEALENRDRRDWRITVQSGPRSYVAAKPPR